MKLDTYLIPLTEINLKWIKTYKLLHSTGNHQQNEKTTYKLGENICKQ